MVIISVSMTLLSSLHHKIDLIKTTRSHQTKNIRLCIGQRIQNSAKRSHFSMKKTASVTVKSCENVTVITHGVSLMMLQHEKRSASATRPGFVPSSSEIKRRLLAISFVVLQSCYSVITTDLRGTLRDAALQNGLTMSDQAKQLRHFGLV